MAGHSKFKNIQHRKDAQDKKKAKVFTKLIKEIVTAAKLSGADMNNNPRLRNAVISARTHNLPKNRIEKALQLALDPLNTNSYIEMRYIGFIPGGIGIIVESLTDNKNRTVAEVRNIFTKYGGNLGELGTINSIFDQVGIIQYSSNISSVENITNSAIEGEASDIIHTDGYYTIHTDVSCFSKCLAYMNDKYGKPYKSGIEWIPQHILTVDTEYTAKNLLELTEFLEDLDDTQKIFVNYEVCKKLLAILLNR